MTLSPICVYCKASDNSTILYDTNDIFENQYTINQCKICNAYFLCPNPTDEQLSKAYDDSYYGEREEKFGYVTEKILDYFRKKRASLVSSYILEKRNILDIGCGNGRFLKFMLHYGNFNLHGIEMPGKSAERARNIQEIKLKIGKLEEKDYPDNFFDAVTLFHVFEHLSEPLYTLNIISKILKKEGVCVMSFPNIDSFQARIFKGNWLHLDPPRHLFYFKPDDFVVLALGLGLVVENTSFMNVEQNPYGMIQSILNCFAKKRELLFESLKGNTGYLKNVPKSTIMIHRLFFMLTFPLFILSDAFESLLHKGATVQFVLRKR